MAAAISAERDRITSRRDSDRSRLAIEMRSRYAGEIAAAVAAERARLETARVTDHELYAAQLRSRLDADLATALADTRSRAATDAEAIRTQLEASIRARYAAQTAVLLEEARTTEASGTLASSLTDPAHTAHDATSCRFSDLAEAVAAAATAVAGVHERLHPQRNNAASFPDNASPTPSPPTTSVSLAPSPPSPIDHALAEPATTSQAPFSTGATATSPTTPTAVETAIAITAPAIALSISIPVTASADELETPAPTVFEPTPHAAAVDAQAPTATNRRDDCHGQPPYDSNTYLSPKASVPSERAPSPLSEAPGQAPRPPATPTGSISQPVDTIAPTPNIRPAPNTDVTGHLPPITSTTHTHTTLTQTPPTANHVAPIAANVATDTSLSDGENDAALIAATSELTQSIAAPPWGPPSYRKFIALLAYHPEEEARPLSAWKSKDAYRSFLSAMQTHLASHERTRGYTLPPRGRPDTANPYTSTTYSHVDITDVLETWELDDATTSSWQNGVVWASSGLGELSFFQRRGTTSVVMDPEVMNALVPSLATARAAAVAPAETTADAEVAPTAETTADAEDAPAAARAAAPPTEHRRCMEIVTPADTDLRPVDADTMLPGGATRSHTAADARAQEASTTSPPTTHARHERVVAAASPPPASEHVTRGTPAAIPAASTAITAEPPRCAESAALPPGSATSPTAVTGAATTAPVAVCSMERATEAGTTAPPPTDTVVPLPSHSSPTPPTVPERPATTPGPSIMLTLRAAIQSAQRPPPDRVAAPLSPPTSRIDGSADDADRRDTTNPHVQAPVVVVTPAPELPPRTSSVRNAPTSPPIYGDDGGGAYDVSYGAPHDASLGPTASRRGNNGSALSSRRAHHRPAAPGRVRHGRSNTKTIPPAPTSSNLIH